MADLSDERRQTTDLRRRLVLGFVAIIGIVVVYTVVYHWAVVTIGGVEDRSPIKTLQVVVEALTTAGFGGDTGLWREHTELAFMVLVMNLTGVLLVFLAIPLFGVPLLRNALDGTPPTTSDLRDHVIICGYSTADDVLTDELEEAGIPYLFVESDRDMAEQLIAADIPAIQGSAEQVETLENANAEHARALVADLNDETNPTVILSAKRVNPSMRVVSVVQTRGAVPHHKYAGADDVVVSKESLGESFAQRSIKTVSERFQEAVGVDAELELNEYLVEENSSFVGQTIEEIGVLGGDVTVIGGWFGPRFLISPTPETTIQKNSILLVTDERGRLEESDLRKLPSHIGHPSRVIVCGYGDVGSATARRLTEDDVEVTVVDAKPGDSIDVVGDITEPETLDRAAIDNTRSLVLAVNDDTAAIYAALLVKHLQPDVEIIARANDPGNVWKLYNAGVDYVLSLPDIVGEELASTLVGDAEILTPTDEFDFVRTKAPTLEGQSLIEADIRHETGCTVVAIERDGELRTDFDAGFTFERDDVLLVAGTDEAIQRFKKYVA